ncbi:nuclease-related domain-containing protein [Aerococcus kribbianus]|uniref:Nuclease-related domain-containing protein n=1 Tax=Aerococcus kribbianus TaxID=2999064 RepID=A0A9X3FWC0_9LACT|nr:MULTISPECIES: nuclease-related domain-containing protein [unclassified Aerococcus]MCZ0717434.1 nuclease-related domain-containing protein [Aerococcus sp. YH-aer221]MCZ0725722.1 nuclease-related domain-containing protein [Aerococcus sp. YH-aer222]
MAGIKRLALLKEMQARKLLSNKADLEREWSWQEKGMQGEKTMEELLVEDLPQVVTILHDVTLEFAGLTQCDFIALTANFWLLVEVKNYNGLMTYQDQRCRLRGEDLRADQMAAMRNRLRIVKKLAHSVDPKLVVEAAMVFIHPNGEVEWDSQEDFAILTRNQIHPSKRNPPLIN